MMPLGRTLRAGMSPRTGSSPDGRLACRDRGHRSWLVRGAELLRPHALQNGPVIGLRLLDQFLPDVRVVFPRGQAFENARTFEVTRDPFGQRNPDEGLQKIEQALMTSQNWPGVLQELLRFDLRSIPPRCHGPPPTHSHAPAMTIGRPRAPQKILLIIGLGH